MVCTVGYLDRNHKNNEMFGDEVFEKQLRDHEEECQMLVDTFVFVSTVQEVQRRTNAT